MRTAIGVLAILSLGSSMLTLAEEPTAPPAAPQAAAAPAAPEGATPNAPAAAPTADASNAAPTAPASDAAPPVAHAATSANSSAPAAAAGAGTSLTDEDRSFIRRGYQIEMKKGEKYYCREQQTMGSRVNKKRVCMRSDQMDQLRENAQDNMREKVRNNKFEG